MHIFGIGIFPDYKNHLFGHFCFKMCERNIHQCCKMENFVKSPPAKRFAFPMKFPAILPHFFNNIFTIKPGFFSIKVTFFQLGNKNNHQQSAGNVFHGPKNEVHFLIEMQSTVSFCCAEYWRKLQNCLPDFVLPRQALPTRPAPPPPGGVRCMHPGIWPSTLTAEA